MDNQPSEFSELFAKYRDNQASPVEVDRFFALAAEPANRALLEGMLDKTWEELSQEPSEMWGNRKAPVIQRARMIFLRPLQWVAAASVLALLGSGIYFLSMRNGQKVSIGQIAPVKNDIAPGGNKAILTLAGGRQIILESAHIGQLAIQNNIKVVKSDSGRLSYKATGEQPLEIAYNTLSTPRGGQYQLQLADGTHVWLNAFSSITYPTAFTGKERIVEITGEVYFEVVHNAKMPFKVKAEEQVIEDIGTAFNVNAYTDEPVKKTTLVEGSVKVSLNNENKILKPGQQAMIENSRVRVVDHADIASATAWKNGIFQFRNASLEDVMRQIARWYNVEVEYKGTIPSRAFGGKIPRNSNASEVLKILELSNVHFVIEGKKIIVMP